jgi:hypothetical protein
MHVWYDIRMSCPPKQRALYPLIYIARNDDHGVFVGQATHGGDDDD